MKTITTSISGLASSLFLNIGFTWLAQMLDPVTNAPCAVSASAQGPAFTLPCNIAHQTQR